MSDLIIFLVLGGLALLFRWLTNQASNQPEKPSRPLPNEPLTREPTESDEERVRKFLEALGVPQGTPPPPPVKPRPVRPRRVVTPQAQPPKVRRSFVQPLPPLVTTPEEPPPSPVTSSPEATGTMFEVAPPSPLPELPAMPVAATPLLVRHEPVPPTATVGPPATSLGKVGDRSTLRQVIIWREILGPPRGLQPLAQAGGF